MNFVLQEQKQRKAIDLNYTLKAVTSFTKIWLTTILIDRVNQTGFGRYYFTMAVPLAFVLGSLNHKSPLMKICVIFSL